MKKFDIFMVNVFNVYTHLLDVKEDMFAQQSDWVFLTETWINPNDDHKRIFWPGRVLTHASIGNGRGVCCYGPEKSSTMFLNDCIRPMFQMQSMLIKDEFQVIIAYCSTDCNFNEVAACLKEIIIPHLKILLLGDFNFSYKDENNAMVKLLKNLGFKQKVNHPTHTKARTIDHIYFSDNIVDNSIVIDYHFNYYSDHCSFNITL